MSDRALELLDQGALNPLEHFYDEAFDILRVPHETATDPSGFIDNEGRRGSHDLEHLAAVEVAVEEDGEITPLLADHIPAAFQISRDLYAEKPETELVLSLLQAGWISFFSACKQPAEPSGSSYR